ncbi:MAG: 3-phosphoshikimate 1-carboxyvinyltransferase [Desulfovibrionaceae bacterium]|nr:3-phosphoshikimate 1-carboxyvinyltransferase [Desulfovibrionaceae bacterium]
MISVIAPASKSVSHRMMLGAALAKGESHLSHVLDSVDLERTRAVLCAAGACITPCGAGEFRVQGMAGRPQGGTEQQPCDCNVHESGTTCRLLTAVLAAGQGFFAIHGAGRMHQRPIGALVEVLRHVGVAVQYTGQDLCPPLLLHTKGIAGGNVTIGLEESSQYLSGLLFAAPLSKQGMCITIGGKSIVSWPYVGLTLQALESFGIAFRVESLEEGTWQEQPWRSLHTVRPHALRIHIAPAVYRAGSYAVEGDWSGASYLLAAGAVHNQPVLVKNLRADSLQGDKAILDILQRMGAEVQVQAEGILVAPPAQGALQGISLDMNACPDLVPTVAVLAAFAQGTTHIRNVAHLRFKESDRIAAPAQELRTLGIQVDEHEDGLSVQGCAPRLPLVPAGTVLHSHGDHRIAMSLALLGLAGRQPVLDDPSVVQKSFPTFWEVWRDIAS